MICKHNKMKNLKNNIKKKENKMKKKERRGQQTLYFTDHDSYFIILF